MGVMSAFRRCVTDLTKEASSFYPAAASAASGAATCPFEEWDDTASASSAAASDHPPALPVPPATQAATEWRFDTAEEEGAKICLAETEVGDVKVGFMAFRERMSLAFVAGLFSGQITTKWKVDNKAPHISDGVEDTYFAWHSFDHVSEALLADVSGGNELRIAKLGGKHLVVPLQGAKQALSSLAECVGKPKPASSAAGPQTEPQPASKHAQSCLLQVNGTKVIDGPCSWEPYGSDGTDFQMTANGFFALLFMEDADNATGYWNETANSVHAHAQLGNLIRSGNCWANENVQMCVGG